jgi:hypothetical protein
LAIAKLRGRRGCFRVPIFDGAAALEGSEFQNGRGMWKGLKKLGESWIVDGVESTAIKDVLDQESHDPKI